MTAHKLFTMSRLESARHAKSRQADLKANPLHISLRRPRRPSCVFLALLKAQLRSNYIRCN